MCHPFLRSITRACTPGMLFACALYSGISAGAQTTPVSVLTQRYNNQRTGLNNQESILNTGNVQSATFGRLFTKAVNGMLRAQPLYVPNLTIQGAQHNVVFAATLAGSVYAYDADNPLTPALWTTNLVPAGASATATGNLGIISTPAIDPTTNTLYVVCKTLEGPLANPSSFVFRIHALDLLTGQEKPQSPVPVNFSVHGNGVGSIRGVITFNGAIHATKPALLLTQGKLILAFAAGGNATTPYTNDYHGFVVAYDATTLKQVGIWCSTPNGSKGGIWQCSNGLLSDDQGNIWVTTGDGTTSPATGNYGMATVRLTLSSSGALSVADYFVPYNYVQLSQNDADLGVNGPVAIAGSKYGLQGSKQGYLYTLDPLNLGGISTNQADSNIPQSYLASNGEMHSDPTSYVGSDGTTTVFYMSENDYIYGIHVLPSGLLDWSTGLRSPNPGLGEGGWLSASSLGTTAGTGILWCYRIGENLVNGSTTVQVAVLEAYDPTTLQLLWSSAQTPNRDQPGGWGKWSYPIVANGKVYVGDSPSALTVYGLLSTGAPAAPTGLHVTGVSPGGVISLAWNSVPGAVGYNVRANPYPGGPYSLRFNNQTGTTANLGFTAFGTNQFNYYVVSAVNSSGESVNSAELAFSPWPQPPVISESTSQSGAPTISWQAVNYAQSYTVLRGTVKGGPYTTTLTSGFTGLSYTDSSAVPGTTYYYVAVAVNHYGSSGYSNEVHN